MDHDTALAKVSTELVDRIEEAAVAAAREILSGRRILDVDGPYGVGLTTVEVGNDELTQDADSGLASAVVSRALAVPMIYRRFSISKRHIAAFEERGQPMNLKAAEDTAQEVAAREEDFIYHGQPNFHLGGLLTVEGRHILKAGNWQSVDRAVDDVIHAVNILDGSGYRGPYGLALAPELYNNLFRRYPGSELLQIEHLKRLCTRGIAKAAIQGAVLVASDVGSIVLGQDLQVAHLSSDAAHENFAVSESLVLKIEAPDAICAITVEGVRPSRARK